MSPEQRREMIVRTALPLVAEHGTAVTTGQIARAAGIGEATIFRVFADKDALLDACVAEALRADHVLAELADISLDQPLPARLGEAAAAMEAYLERMGMVIGALHATGRHDRGRHDRGRHAGGEEADTGLDRDSAMRLTVEALTELFEPERDALRLPPEQVAAMFMGLVFGRARPPAQPVPSLEETLQVFLYGALAEGERA
ncbi:TetR/AcrR family transcriptional regulator [Actinomadura rudentiformis]|uniref:TetR/AcrR family transcriptional regulator n=2 Tax=Actinomadura rudentiformis TaxID=359158 RepID=A0A6H9YG11_9ACTN|nr:TetR/AcrR family transcriptional regulator [Actinomadura rudentiformis]